MLINLCNKNLFWSISAVLNLFLLAYPLAEKRKLAYPLMSCEELFQAFSKKNQCKSYTDENLAYPLRFLTYPWGFAYPRLGTAGLYHRDAKLIFVTLLIKRFDNLALFIQTYIDFTNRTETC
jgi:hypothetical protein